MKKKLAIIVIIAVFLIGICCYNNQNLSRPITDLEFWIAENVEDVDFSNYQEKHGLMGGREYYGSGYIPQINADGEQIDPVHCVIYTVTSYPDYISNQSHITRIFITDPTIEVYGLTLYSNIEEIEHTMKRKGFKTEYSAGGLTARKGKFTFVFSEESIRINVKVTNVFGIQF